MPRFHVESDTLGRLDLDCDNWMTALGDALARFDVHDPEGAECEVGAEGDIRVKTPVGDFVIRELPEAASEPVSARIWVGEPVAPRLGSLPLDLPEPKVLDAPDLTAAPALRLHEETGDELVGEIAERSAELLESETGESACAFALDLLMEYVPAEAGAVLIADRRTKDLRFVAARGPRARGLVGLPVPSGRGIAGLTVRAGVALTIREAAGDPRHYAEVDKRTGYRTHAILSVPIRGPAAPIGCIQLLNPFAGMHFLHWHQTAMQVVAARIAERLG